MVVGVEAAGACFHLATQPPPPPPPPLLHHFNTPAPLSLFTPQFPRLSSSSSHLIIGKRRTIGRRRRNQHAMRRAISSPGQEDMFFFANDGNDDDDDDEEDEFVSHLLELADRLRLTNHHEKDNSSSDVIIPDSRSNTTAGSSSSSNNNTNSSFSSSSSIPFPLPEFRPDWPDLVPASVEKNANSIDLPLSLRMIKRRKNNNNNSITTIGESAACSVKKAFSSMVFIIRELQSYTLELLFVEKKLLDRVHCEMHASFVWLFQQIFSCTPTLMLSLMLLLADFTVHSAGHTIAASTALPLSHSTTTLITQHTNGQFNPSSTNSSSFSDDGNKAASVGGSGRGGGKTRPVAGATDDGQSDGRASSSSSSYYSSSSTDTAPSTTTPAEESTTTTPAAVPDEKEEDRLWNMVVEEALRMQAALRDETLMDPEILQRLVSPVTAEVEQEDQSAYTRTELTYYKAIAEDPYNPLLLCNFAHFLYIVIRDYDRAEHYFKQAVKTEPRDAESLARYASFLWLARNDLAAAEETYLEAIAADPDNSFHTSSYAHFLYSTGGEDTCYPL